MKICFKTEEISEFLLHENAVPDALLPKAWFMSETSAAFNNIIYHTRQRVIHNNVRPDKTYTVKIMLKDSRKIKQFQQYTYELVYYDGPVVRARVHSTFVQEGHDEN
ncbi:hypothetical protein [Macrococcus equipercicus]|uniref:hypothetical protein n=1 Tax=Macrococcus equipercicus TaxID=69967 RepID=UPI00147898B1|nr:hypothetical protein [Macrococcus equipercicus]